MSPRPLVAELPNPDGTSSKYKSSQRLAEKKALITGGDSGIGRSVAVLYALEGAQIYVTHLPSEAQDAEETKKLVEQHGGTIHLQSVDLRSSEACKDTIDKARSSLGGLNILVLNHATQNAVNDIKDLTEYVSLTTPPLATRRSVDRKQ